MRNSTGKLVRCAKYSHVGCAVLCIQEIFFQNRLLFHFDQRDVVLAFCTWSRPIHSGVHKKSSAPRTRTFSLSSKFPVFDFIYCCFIWCQHLCGRPEWGQLEVYGTNNVSYLFITEHNVLLPNTGRFLILRDGWQP